MIISDHSAPKPAMLDDSCRISLPKSFFYMVKIPDRMLHVHFGFPVLSNGLCASVVATPLAGLEAYLHFTSPPTSNPPLNIRVLNPHFRSSHYHQRFTFTTTSYSQRAPLRYSACFMLML